MTMPGMSTRELFELAHLDALGMLDDAERASYDAAFRAAPAAIRAQVRAEQARVSRLSGALPEIDPPAGLKDRVLEAVGQAMAAQAAGESREAATRTHASTGSGIGSGVVHAGGGRAGSREARGLSFWRAGAVAMACAALLLGGAFFKVYTDNQNVNRSLAGDAAVNALLVGFGNQQMRDTLFDAATTRAIFARVGVGGGGDGEASADGDAQQAVMQAVLFRNPDWSRSRLFAQLPATRAGGAYRLVVVDDEGRVLENLEQFTSNGQLLSIEVSRPLTPGTRIAIASVGAGERGAPVLMLATMV
jgi:hypothetical protein